MDPALWELLRAEAGASGDQTIEAIIRLARPGIEIPGVRIVSRFGTIATCRIRARDVIAVRARRDVASVKAARVLSPGFEPAAASPDLASPAWPGERATDVRGSPALGLTGIGVVVAAVDWGVDVDAAAFRWPDDPAAADVGHEAGTTRLLSFWDQRDQAVGPRPDPYGYGTVHSRKEIDRALQDPRPYERLGYHPAIADRSGRGSHGTRTVDIAAGNGQGGGPVGIAPDADLIFVHLADRNTGGLANFGDSVRLLEAVDFISRTAGTQSCVINISAGRICGPKDGTTLVERALDELLAATPGRFVVNSAGNYFGWRAHACGTIAPGEVRSLTFAVAPTDITANEVEIWYDGADEFAVRIDPPGYTGSRPVRLGERSDLLIEGRVIGRVYHREHDPNNGDNHIVAYLDPVGRAGNWTVTLEARRVSSGRFHAWIERDDTCPGCQARFTHDDSNPATTIGSIATSHLPLIVGAYDSHDSARPIAAFSSAGPGRDGRCLLPNLVAPGVDVLTARSAPIGASRNPGLLTRGNGTSFAAPHVTGAVALCFEAAGNRLSAHEIRSLVLGSCDPIPDADPQCRLGRGYLNIPRLIADTQQALAASAAAPGAEEPTMDTEDTIVLLAAAPGTAYREFLYRPRGELARWIGDHYDVVARPGQRISQALQEGDVLLEVTLGRMSGGRCIVLDGPELEVMQPWPRLAHGQLILRPLRPVQMSEPMSVEPAAIDTPGWHTSGTAAAMTITSSVGTVDDFAARHDDGEDDSEASGPDTATADAFVLDSDSKAYFTTFPQLGDLTIRSATVLTPAHFESLMDHMLSSDQKNFVIDAHGEPAGLYMPLSSGTKCSATRISLFMLAGIEHIRTLMRLADESDTIWERASGADLDKWRRIVEVMHSATWRNMIGRSWPRETPRVDTVAKARSLVRSRISALVDALFPGDVSGKQRRVDSLIEKMLRLRARGIREIQFRACNIGKDSGTLHEFRRFFGADHLCAPDVRNGFGPTSLSISPGRVDDLAKRSLTQVYDLPSGRFAIRIKISGEHFTATCAAATQAVVDEWVAAHLMPGSRYHKGAFPIHFLETEPRAFALDKEYAAHIQCRSSFWEGAVRAHEREEEEAHWDEEATGAEAGETAEFDLGGRPDDIEMEEAPEAGDAWARALEPAVPEQDAESLDPDLPVGKAETTGPIGDEAGEDIYAPAVSEGQADGEADAVDPFPRHPYVLSLEMTNQPFSACAGAVEDNPVTRPMCGAVADVTGNPGLPAFYAHNPIDMLYVASLAKIYPMYVAFELRKRVEEQARDMIKLGLSTAAPGWEGQVFATLEKAWEARLRAAFPGLPECMPKFSEIFVLSATGKASFAENDPPLTDADLDFRPPNPTPGGAPISPEFKKPPGKFRDWMRLMLRWSNNEAASNCIRALGYPYINGVLGAAGFFHKSSRTGLWLSGDYLGNDWLKGNRAGQPLSPRWARLQGREVTNFAGTAFQVARLLTLLAQGRLVDKDSSAAMLGLMTGVAGIGSYIRGALAGAAPPRAFTTIASKIGCGNEVPPPACGFSHDCAIVRVDRGADQARAICYVVVALGSHPDQARADLRTMVVRFHDCVGARHP